MSEICLFGMNISTLLVVIYLTHFNVSYNLLPYTTTDKSSDRISHIRISEENFAQWLLDYRAKVTQVEEEEEEGHWAQYGRR